jgi:hypothetical protein
MVALVSEEHAISTDRYPVRAAKYSSDRCPTISAETVRAGAGNCLDTACLELNDAKSIIPLVGDNQKPAEWV